MKKRFKELWAKAGAESNSETAFEIISAGYLEPQRFYHNLDHVWQCILVLDAISQSEPVSSAMEIELALWFHDIVYDSQKNPLWWSWDADRKRCRETSRRGY